MKGVKVGVKELCMAFLLATGQARNDIFCEDMQRYFTEGTVDLCGLALEKSEADAKSEKWSEFVQVMRDQGHNPGQVQNLSTAQANSVFGAIISQASRKQAGIDEIKWGNWGDQVDPKSDPPSMQSSIVCAGKEECKSSSMQTFRVQM